NWADFEKLNGYILKFKENPQEFIDPGSKGPSIEVQLKIAILRAQISEYVDIIDWEQTKLQDIESQITLKEKLLKEAQSRNGFTKMFSSLEQTLQQEFDALNHKKEEYTEESRKLSSDETSFEISSVYKETQRFNTATLLDESQLLRRMLKEESASGKYTDAFTALPQQKALSVLHDSISRTSEENEKDYIQRVEEILKLKNTAPPPANIEEQLKRHRPQMTSEDQANYEIRIEAIKGLTAEQITEIDRKVKEYKKLTQNPLLSLESQAILSHLHKIHVQAEVQTDEAYRAELEALTTAFGEYEKAKKEASAGPAAGEEKAAEESPLAPLKRLVLPMSYTTAEGEASAETKTETETDEAYLQRVSNIVDVYEKLKRSESASPSAETLFSTPDNPLVSATYHVGKVDQTIDFPKELLNKFKKSGYALEFQAPITTSATLGYQNGASLIQSPDGQLSVAVHQNKNAEIDYERVEKSENQLIANISKMLDTMQSPLIQLSNMKRYRDNEEDQKIRFIRKLVESYCIENGKVNLEKYIKVRDALTKETKTQSPTLNNNELFSPDYEFLVKPQALLTKTIQPIKSLIDTQSFREKLKNQQDKASFAELNEKTFGEKFLGFSQDRKKQIALAAWKELVEAKLDGKDINSKAFEAQRKCVKEFENINDTGPFDKKLEDLTSSYQSELHRNIKKH
ncbi:MAG TPA: hypothetical protein DCZ80_07195, partial [Legionellales bacterium]|nr:hypothetical protein [Legionellales bacterium]